MKKPRGTRQPSFDEVKGVIAYLIVVVTDKGSDEIKEPIVLLQENFGFTYSFSKSVLTTLKKMGFVEIKYGEGQVFRSLIRGWRKVKYPTSVKILKKDINGLTPDKLKSLYPRLPSYTPTPKPKSRTGREKSKIERFKRRYRAFLKERSSGGVDGFNKL